MYPSDTKMNDSRLKPFYEEALQYVRQFGRTHRHIVLTEVYLLNMTTWTGEGVGGNLMTDEGYFDVQCLVGSMKRSHVLVLSVGHLVDSNSDLLVFLLSTLRF